jgi:uncharacterized protein YfiM (DUF2279 family)
MNKILALLFSIILLPNCYSQQIVDENSTNFFKPSDTLNIPRRTTVIISESVLTAGAVVALNQYWYKDQVKSSFRFNHDANGWGMMDKAAHGFFSYQLTRFTAEAFNWSGESKENQLIYGAAFGFGAGVAKEVLDGFTKEWGWSWYDFGFNIFGTGLYVGQELLWNEQRIQPKFSYNNSRSKGITTSNVGPGYVDRLFKNYDGQTFWLSFNINSFAKTQFIPNWLNFSVGYGVEGYLYNPNLAVFPERSKSLYLSFDVDLTKIKTKSHFINTLFSICNTIKIPAPTIEFNSKQGTKGHILFF